MAVRLAKTAGFCYGVRRALGMALSESQDGKSKLQTLGPLIHNQQVIDLLKSKKILCVNNVDDINADKVLIRAHGVKPEIKEKLADKNVIVIDATCPHVSKAQKIIRKHTDEGYNTIIVGDKGHAEVVGLLGYSGGKGFVIENIEEVDSLPPLDKVCIVAQTTQNEEKFNIICKKIIDRYKKCVVCNTICKATEQRQSELVELAKSVDLMVIVGGKESANTTRLFELSAATGTKTIHIETADDLNLSVEEAQRYKEIGVTAGASTPYWIIRNVVEDLEDLQRTANPFILRIIYRTARAFTHSNILLAAGAAAMTAVVAKFMGIKTPMPIVLLSFFYILSMHLLNKFILIPSDKSLAYGSLKFFTKHQKILLAIAGICIIGAFGIAIRLNIQAFVIMLLSLFAGIVYGMAIFPKWVMHIIKYKSLMAIPGSKDFFSAIGWVIVVALMPFIENYSTSQYIPLLLSSLFVFALSFSRSVLLDVRDIEGDITISKETIPVFLGQKNAVMIIRVFLLLAFFLPILGALYNFLPAYSFLLCLIPVYVFAVDYFMKKSNYYHIWYYDALIELQFIIAGIIALYIA